MTEDQDAKETQPDTGSKIFVNNNKYKKLKTQRPLTKVINFLRKHPDLLLQRYVLIPNCLLLSDYNETSTAYNDGRIISGASVTYT